MPQKNYSVHISGYIPGYGWWYGAKVCWYGVIAMAGNIFWCYFRIQEERKHSNTEIVIQDKSYYIKLSPFIRDHSRINSTVWEFAIQNAKAWAHGVPNSVTDRILRNLSVGEERRAMRMGWTNCLQDCLFGFIWQVKKISNLNFCSEKRLFLKSSDFLTYPEIVRYLFSKQDQIFGEIKILNTSLPAFF